MAPANPAASRSSRQKPGRSAPASNAISAFAHRADRYATAVTVGATVAGPLVRLACARHLKDRALAAQPGGHPRGFSFDPASADHIIAFFEEVLRLPDQQDEFGDPRPFQLQPAQVFIIGSLFGWKNVGGFRRFINAYIETGKGSGKSPLLAGIGLYGLVMDNEIAAEIYSAAVAQDQAKILWTDAKRMVEASPELRELIEISANNLAYHDTHSFFRPFSREQGARSGTRPHMGLIDEVHEHPNAEAVKKIRAGAKGRKQPLFIEITNSGFDRTSICWQHHEHSRKVLEGTVVDEHWFAYVCALDEGDDPLEDSSCWPKANPLLGVTIREDYLLRQVEMAKNIPAETNTVLQLNFCVWTNAVSRYFDAAKWAACDRVVSDDELAGAKCYAGLDAGQSDDFSAFVILWVLEDGRKVVRPRLWLPRAALEKYPHRPYAEWERACLLEITHGDITDYDVIEDAVIKDCQRWGVRELAYDKRFIQQMALHLQGAGITCTDQPQGFALNEAMKSLSEWVQSGDLCHGGHLILSWMASNMVARRGRNGEQRPDKDAAKEKIDGIVALIMAAARAIVQPDEPASRYDTEGVMLL